MNNFQLPDQTSIGQVHLQTRNLARLGQFYRDILGFKEIQAQKNTLCLSATGKLPALIVLTENLQLLAPQRSSPGLFHTAFLLPSRPALALVLKRLLEHNIRLGFGDHAVSEAIYLSDPDGNGVELYADRPRSQWPLINGQVQMTTEPVDTVSLLNELNFVSTTWTGIHEQTTIGHMHLQVSSIAKAEQFYHQLLGFDITQRSYPGALFVSAGGYHHHLGLNIWNSRNAPPTTHHTTGMYSFTIVVPATRAIDTIAQHLASENIKAAYIQEQSISCQDYDGIRVEIRYAPGM